MTPKESKLLAAFHDSRLKCRQIALEAISHSVPTARGVLEENFNVVDAISVEMMQRKLPWGEGLQKLMATKAASEERLRQIGQATDEVLQQQHNIEVSQRQAAAAATGQALQQAGAQMQQNIYNQQLINSLNRPVTTNCNTFGNTLNCRSY